jgi:hypothetical protein
MAWVRDTQYHRHLVLTATEIEGMACFSSWHLIPSDFRWSVFPQYYGVWVERKCGHKRLFLTVTGYRTCI